MKWYTDISNTESVTDSVKKKVAETYSMPRSIISSKYNKERRDRLGTLISKSSDKFGEALDDSSTKSKRKNTFQVTFKDNQTGEPLASIIKVESYKKYNSLDPNVKLWWVIM